jgi:hypothetical protein
MGGNVQRRESRAKVGAQRCPSLPVSSKVLAATSSATAWIAPAPLVPRRRRGRPPSPSTLDQRRLRRLLGLPPRARTRTDPSPTLRRRARAVPARTLQNHASGHQMTGNLPFHGSRTLFHSINFFPRPKV